MKRGKTSNLSFLLLMLVILMGLSYLWQSASGEGKLTYSQVRQLFVQERVSAFTVSDNTLTMNQLQLIAKAPFVFNVTEDNLLSAKNFFLAMCEDRPAIFVNSFGDKPQPVLESTQMKIDPALFELFDRFECQILEYLGFPCVPITKRAQQSVSEVQSNDAKIYMRRQEKLKQRSNACDRINAMFGVSLRCVSVIDEDLASPEADSEGGENAENGGDDDAQSGGYGSDS